MTAPDLSVDANRDLLRRIIEARAAYERLCGFAPTCIHVNGPFLKALVAKGFKEGAEIAGMKIMASPESIADMALCSRDQDLFKSAAPVASANVAAAKRGKAKSR